MAGSGVFAKAAGTGAWLLAGATLVTTGLIALDLIGREVMLYACVLIVPLVLFAEVFAPFVGWAKKILMVTFALVAAKPVLVLVLALAGLLVGSGVTGL